MTNPCCPKFKLHTSPDMAALYGAICAAVPPCYLCGQGFSNDRLRFGLEGGLQAELRFCGDRCEVWLRHCPPDKAAAAAGVWAVRTVRDELRQNLTDLTNPSSTARQTIPEPEPDPDVGLEEEELWLDLPDTAEQAANSVAGVPQPVPGSLSASSGAASGSGSVHEPSALRTDSAPAASSAAPASTQPFSGRVLNAYSGDELVYSKTLGDWRTHNGIDYAAAKGEKVSAPAAGKVTLAGADGSWGPTVAIEDASGRLWRISGSRLPSIRSNFGGLHRTSGVMPMNPRSRACAANIGRNTCS